MNNSPVDYNSFSFINFWVGMIIIGIVLFFFSNLNKRKKARFQEKQAKHKPIEDILNFSKINEIDIYKLLKYPDQEHIAFRAAHLVIACIKLQAEPRLVLRLLKSLHLHMQKNVPETEEFLEALKSEITRGLSFEELEEYYQTEPKEKSPFGGLSEKSEIDDILNRILYTSS
jgi:hypothetical protein